METQHTYTQTLMNIGTSLEILRRINRECAKPDDEHLVMTTIATLRAEADKAEQAAAAMYAEEVARA